MQTQSFIRTWGHSRSAHLPLLPIHSTVHLVFQRHSCPPLEASHPCSSSSHSRGFLHIVYMFCELLSSYSSPRNSSGVFGKPANVPRVSLVHEHVFPVIFHSIWLISYLYLTCKKLYVIYLLTCVPPPPKKKPYKFILSILAFYWQHVY